jgi:thiamine-phosphate pyrophosphorylase
MSLKLQSPLLYLITSGATTAQTTRASKEFSHLLELIEAAVAAKIDLIQIREKRLKARVLFELAERCAQLVRGSNTRLLVNDRADIAVGSGADGVHLATTSLETAVVRQVFGEELLIGVSTHSLSEAVAARAGGADFVVFGPVFQKEGYGDPVGIDALRACASQLSPFPVLALGGIAEENVGDCLAAGAAGIAAIRLFENIGRLSSVRSMVFNER